MTERLLHTAVAPFEAARRVSILPSGHRSRRLHGHSFLAKVRADLPPDWVPFTGAETGALSEALTTCVAALDYRDLNEQLPIPTDENLARWIRECLAVPGIETVGVQSTKDQGADLDDQDQVHVWRRFRFEAAHRSPMSRRDTSAGACTGTGSRSSCTPTRTWGAGTSVWTSTTWKRSGPPSRPSSTTPA